MTAARPWDSMISIPELLGLYKEGIDKHGGGFSNPKEGCLEGALGNAMSAEGYACSGADDSSAPGLMFSVSAMVYLVVRHCFIDGNKRVGWLAMIAVLMKLGLSIKATEDEAVEFVLSVAKGETGREAALEWVASRLESAP